uniref:LEF-5 n=1 Tax=Faxonius propinquus nudivirus TaxID=3139431 RepID=A0AAU8GCS0_9VIRU
MKKIQILSLQIVNNAKIVISPVNLLRRNEFAEIPHSFRACIQFTKEYNNNQKKCKKIKLRRNSKIGYLKVQGIITN